MIASANYVKKELEDGGLLDKAFAAHPDYKLVLTGEHIFSSFTPPLTFKLFGSSIFLKIKSQIFF